MCTKKFQSFVSLTDLTLHKKSPLLISINVLKCFSLSCLTFTDLKGSLSALKLDFIRSKTVLNATFTESYKIL